MLSSSSPRIWRAYDAKTAPDSVSRSPRPWRSKRVAPTSCCRAASEADTADSVTWSRAAAARADPVSTMARKDCSRAGVTSRILCWPGSAPRLSDDQQRVRAGQVDRPACGCDVRGHARRGDGADEHGAHRRVPPQQVGQPVDGGAAGIHLHAHHVQSEVARRSRPAIRVRARTGHQDPVAWDRKGSRTPGSRLHAGAVWLTPPGRAGRGRRGRLARLSSTSMPIAVRVSRWRCQGGAAARRCPARPAPPGCRARPRRRRGRRRRWSPDRRASTSAAESTTSPRALLIRNADGFIRASRRLVDQVGVRPLPGICSETKCGLAATPRRWPPGGRRESRGGLEVGRRRNRRRASGTRSAPGGRQRPIRPIPMMPSVLPVTSAPIRCVGRQPVHRPDAARAPPRRPGERSSAAGSSRCRPWCR